ncbi:hypothetical protein DKM44_03850 [Deinococcus irradiatisoli]|uniref:Uncharacterized protein n=1 Tax=Deinococcus irradiatisoli TaxID=2202254 RepID=A0A2Z3JER6_9DEIO|nr:hypothetical protein DKM44_03850 [Deinococcus irradiatisoli]
MPSATGAKWTITYPPNDPYLVAGQLAGGLMEGALVEVAGEPGWWTWDEDDQVFGAEIGDVQPPLVTVKILPTMPAGKSMLPIEYKGHPRETAEDTWDLSRIGMGGLVLLSEAQRLTVEALIEQGNMALARLIAVGGISDEELQDRLDAIANGSALAADAQAAADLLPTLEAGETALNAALAAVSLNARLIGWAQSDSIILTSVVYDTTNANSAGVPISATATWPDGSGGSWTATNRDATTGYYLGYTVTHTASGKTITQAPITIDAIGNLTAQSLPTVS